MEIIDTTDWPQSDKTDLAKELMYDEGGLNHLASVAADARSGDLDDTPRTITTTYTAESRSAALGKAYSLRDVLIEEGGVDASANLTDRAWKTEATTFFEVDIHINGGD